LQIIEKLKKIDDHLYGDISVTIGNFDGFHRGHLKILKTLIKESRKRGLYTSVITFKEHPLKILFDKDPGKIITLDEKIRIFKREGVDVLFLINFSKEFSQITPAEFLDLVKENISPKFLCLGKGFRFGKDNKGDINFLKRNTKRYGYEIFSIPDLKYLNIPISSTRIRKAIKDGNIELVERLLGRRYCIYLSPINKSKFKFEPFIPDMVMPWDGRYGGLLMDSKIGKRKKATFTIFESIFILNYKESIDHTNDCQILYKFCFEKLKD